MADVLYEVEEIVGKKIIPHRRVLYRVKWRGFSSDHDSWEPVSNLSACKKLLDSYNNNFDNPVIRENGQISTIRAERIISPGKAGRSEKKFQLIEKEKNIFKEDSQPHKISSVHLPTLDKGGKISKENQTKSSTSKTIQSDIIDVPGKSSVSIGKLNIAKKRNSSDKQFDNKNSSGYSGLLNYILKKRPSNEKKDYVNFLISEPVRYASHKRKRSDANDETVYSVDNEVLHKCSPSAKKQKSHPKLEEKASCSDKSVATMCDNVVDLTKGDNSSNSEVDVSEEIEISDGDDDGNVLYSLNSDCDLLSADSTSQEMSKKSKDILNTKESSDNTQASVISKLTFQTGSAESNCSDHTQKKNNKKMRMSLMVSKKSSKSSTALNNTDLVCSSTPPPGYTNVKIMIGDPTNSDPSKPSGNSLPDPVSPEASETYLADVPSSLPVPAEEPVTDEPLSPSALLYKSLFDNGPEHVRPMSKGNSKKGKGSMGNLAQFAQPSGKSVLERRTSVRSSECAFRYKQIVVKKCSRYTQIWLNTTTVMKNALNPLVIQEILSALSSAKYDDSRLVLFSALGNVFCSGTDLHYLVSGERAVAARQMAEKIRELTKTFIAFPKPIIASVSGAVVGLGVALLILCDVVYASDKASFHLPYSQLSQTPEGCLSFTLPLTVGLPAANDLLYGGRKITAMEACQLGLVSQVFWPTLMTQEIIPRAQNMASCSSKALEATKLLVRSHHRTKMELTNETECNLLLQSWFSVECQQAIEAYIANEKNMSF